MSRPDDITVAQLVSVARLFGRMLTASSTVILEELAQTPSVESVPDPNHALETDIVFEIRHIEPRPGRLSEPQRVALTVIQLGPLPTTETILWESLPIGAPNPYRVGQKYRVKLELL